MCVCGAACVLHCFDVGRGRRLSFLLCCLIFIFLLCYVGGFGWWFEW